MSDTGFKRIHTELAGISAIPSTQGASYGGLVYTSGTGPLKPGGHEMAVGSFREQVEQTLSNIREVLKAGGSDFSHCVRVLVLLRSYDLFAEFNEIYREIVPQPFPPRMCFVTELVHPDILVEMHAIGAVIDESSK